MDMIHNHNIVQGDIFSQDIVSARAFFDMIKVLNDIHCLVITERILTFNCDL